MKKIKSSPRTAKGAVLIMVLTVMFVLIFLLAGTIAVVYSANNAQMNRYKQSQAYYTSRSILDTFMYTFLSDNVTKTSGANIVKYNNLKLKNDGTYEVDELQASQGRALELDIYNLAVDLDLNTPGIQTVFDTEGSAKDKSIRKTTNPRTGVAELSAPEWAMEYILQIVKEDKDAVAKILEGQSGTYKTNGYSSDVEWATAVFRSSDENKEKYTTALYIAQLGINPKTVSSYDKEDPSKWGFPTSGEAYDGDKHPYGTGDFKKFYNQFIPKKLTGTSNLAENITSKDESVTDTVVYVVKGEDLGSYGKYNGTEDYGSRLIMDKDGYATIYMKVLERKYHFAYGVADNFKKKFDEGNREQDYAKVLITVATPYQGHLTETSVIYVTNYDPDPVASSALTSFSNIGTSNSGFEIAGGMSSIQREQYEHVNYNWDGSVQSTQMKDPVLRLSASDISGPVFTMGNLDFATGSAQGAMLNNNATIQCLGDVIPTNSFKIGASSNKSFIYVAGKWKTVAGFKSGYMGDTPTEKIPLIVNYLEETGNDLTVNGTIYSDTFYYNTGNGGKVSADAIYTNTLILNKGQVLFSGNLQEMAGTFGDTTRGTYSIVSIQPDGNPGNKIANNLHVADRIVIKNYFNTDGYTRDLSYEDMNYYGITKKDLVLYVREHDGKEADIVDPSAEINVNYITLGDASDHVYCKYYDCDSFCDADGNRLCSGGTHLADKTDKNALSSNHTKYMKMPGGQVYEIDTAMSKYLQYISTDAFIDSNEVDEADKTFVTSLPLSDFHAWDVDYLDGDSGAIYDKYRVDHQGDLKRRIEDVSHDASKNDKLENYINTAEAKASAYNDNNASCEISGSTTTVTAGATLTDASKKYLIPCGTTLGEVTIDTEANKEFVLQFQKPSASSNPWNKNYGVTFKVKGTGHAVFLIPGGETYNFGASDAECVQIIYEDTKISRSNSDNKVVIGGANATVPPNIDIIVGKDARVCPDKKCMMTGYIYAPHAQFDITSGMSGVNAKYIDNGNTSTGDYWLFGSCVCLRYNNENDGIAFIPRESSSKDASNPIFKWSSVIYTKR